MKTILASLVVFIFGVVSTGVFAQANPEGAATPTTTNQAPAAEQQAQMGGGSKISDNALKYECKSGANTRRIEIISDDAAAKIPCRVDYFKDVENPGVAQTLWSAQNDFAFCEEKAATFASKLEGMGWTCAPKG